jgi:hypothetical protein
VLVRQLHLAQERRIAGIGDQRTEQRSPAHVQDARIVAHARLLEPVEGPVVFAEVGVGLSHLELAARAVRDQRRECALCFGLAAQRPVDERQSEGLPRPDSRAQSNGSDLREAASPRRESSVAFSAGKCSGHNAGRAC